jgi:S-adenosylmethionine synthetase
MVGYATDETEQYMPLPHHLASVIGLNLSRAWHAGLLPWLLPAGTVTVTVEYDDTDGQLIPLHVHSISVLCQHNDTISEAEMKHIILRDVSDMHQLSIVLLSNRYCAVSEWHTSS